MLLFQFLSPVAYALTTDSEPTGFFANLCTIQGNQVVWVEVNPDTQPAPVKAPIECPYCLFNSTASDDDSDAFSTGLLVAHIDLQHLLSAPTQCERYPNAPLHAYSSRAPPHFSI